MTTPNANIREARGTPNWLGLWTRYRAGDVYSVGTHTRHPQHYKDITILVYSSSEKLT